MKGLNEAAENELDPDGPSASMMSVVHTVDNVMLTSSSSRLH